MDFNPPYFLSPLDNIMPKVFIPVLLCFSIPPENTQAATSAIFAGFKKLLQAMPILRYSITAPSAKGPQKGALAVTLPRRTVAEVWRVKDLRGRGELKYSKLRSEKFPISNFTYWDFTMLPFLLDSHPPAMHLQVTLVDGGLILSLCIHHCLADGTGFNVIARALATCCRGESIDVEDVARMWTRPSILENQAQLSPGKSCKQTNYPPMHAAGQSAQTPRSRSSLERMLKSCYNSIIVSLLAMFQKYQSLSLSTRTVHFPNAHLEDLKNKLRDQSKPREGQSQLSRVDSLSALMLCCITQERLSQKQGRKRSSLGTILTRITHRLSFILFRQPKKLPSKLSELTATLRTAVSMRKQCRPPAPSDYIGNLFCVCSLQSRFLDLLPTFENMSALAYSLRAKRAEMDTEYLQREVATIRSAPDVRKLNLTHEKSLEFDLFITSWREQDYCQLDWGREVGVRCEVVRIINYFVEGLSFVLPESASVDGRKAGLDIALSLEKGVMRELERNKLFGQYAQWH